MKKDSKTKRKKKPVVRLHDCKTLNVLGFKECSCNKNYSVLIIEGSPSPDELISAWNDIVMEYGSAIKTENSQYIFDLQKKISQLKQHIDYVDGAILLLLHRFSKKVADELVDMGYDPIVKMDDHVEYAKQLSRIKSLCKSRVMDLCDLEEEYERYHTDEKPGKQQSEDAFEEWLADLGRFQHHPIDQVNTTVKQFIGIINSYIKTHKSKQPQTTNG